MKCTKVLGVQLDKHLKWTQHIEYNVKKCALCLNVRLLGKEYFFYRGVKLYDNRDIKEIENTRRFKKTLRINELRKNLNFLG